jgi:hypothetical protein
MASQEDVRRIVAALPEAAEDPRWFRFHVRDKQFAWAWLQRVDPKKRRVPSTVVIAVRVANELAKQDLLALDPSVFFTEPHYDGYPAVLVRLPQIELPLLAKVLEDGWRVQAPADLRRLLEKRA